MAFGHIWISPQITMTNSASTYQVMAGTTIVTDEPTNYYTVNALVALGGINTAKNHILSFTNSGKETVAWFNLPASELKKAGTKGTSITVNVELRNVKVKQGLQHITCYFDNEEIDSFPIEFSSLGAEN